MGFMMNVGNGVQSECAKTLAKHRRQRLALIRARRQVGKERHMRVTGVMLMRRLEIARSRLCVSIATL
eukprot:223987-Prymnesium_polylepis.1